MVVLRGSREFYRKAPARALAADFAPLRPELCAQGGGHVGGGGAVVLPRGKRLEVDQFTKAFGE